MKKRTQNANKQGDEKKSRDESQAHEDIYRKLLSNKLPANLGFLYENMAAQIIASSGRKLYYHVWRKQNSTHSYEIDFLVISKAKVVPIEVKSSRVKPHDSMDAFVKKYSRQIGEKMIVSGHDIGADGEIRLWPLYCLPALMERL